MGTITDYPARSASYHTGHNGVLMSSDILCSPSNTKEGNMLNKTMSSGRFARAMRTNRV
jgi:hypothetical protein